jgi:VWFA-related protein
MCFPAPAWRTLFVSCCAIGVFMTQAGGQQAQTTAEMTTKDAPIAFSTAVDLVLVPVVVRDAQGHAVGNLTKDDFQLFDKGKLQVITKFSIDKAETPPILPDTSLETDAEGNARPKPPGTAAAEPLASHFIAWVFDDLHISFDDLARTRVPAKRVLKESFEPGTRAAIYTTSGHTQLDFTEDRDKLDAALDEIKPWPTIPSGATSADCPDIGYYQADRMINAGDAQALAVAVAQADYLSCFESGQVQNQANMARSQGQQFDVAAAIATPIRMAAIKALEIGAQDTRNTLLVLKALVRRMQAMPGSRAIVMVSPGFHLIDDHRIDEMDIINSAIRYNVVISSLDARGLWALTPGAKAETGPSHIDPITNSTKTNYELEVARSNEDIMEEFADATGGAFFHNDNDYFSGLKLVATQPEYIYVLGFAPTSLKFNGSYHTLKVTLKNGARLQLQARRGYFERQHLQNAEEQAQEELKDAFFSRDEIRNLPVDLHTQFFKTGDYNARLSIMARVDIRRLRYRKADGRNSDTLTVVGGVFDKDGKYVVGSQKTISLKLKDTTLDTVPEAGITVKSNLDVASGSYVVRLVVRDSEGEVMSALNSALEIPWLVKGKKRCGEVKS